MNTRAVPFTRVSRVAIHAVVVLSALIYFVVAHVAGDIPNDTSVGLGLSEMLMQVLGVPWSLVFTNASHNAAYLIGCAVLNLALHLGWQLRRQ